SPRRACRSRGAPRSASPRADPARDPTLRRGVEPGREIPARRARGRTIDEGSLSSPLPVAFYSIPRTKKPHFSAFEHDSLHEALLPPSESVGLRSDPEER